MRLGICETVAEVVTPFLEKEGLKLWDVEFKKEGAEYFLRVYIDRESGHRRLRKSERLFKPRT